MVVAAERDDHVTLPGARVRKKTLVHLSLRGGNWWVHADIALHANHRSASHLNNVSCTTSLGGSVDHAQVSVLGALSAVADLTAHVAGGGAPLSFACGTDAEAPEDRAVVDHLRLTAFRLSRLVEHDANAGTSSSWGSGFPEARSAFDGIAPVDPSEWTTVASLALGEGDWLAFGKVGHYTVDRVPNDIGCRLSAAFVVRDRSRADMIGNQIPIVPALAYIPAGGRGAGSALLRCKALDAVTVTRRVTSVRLTALRVGSVTVRAI